MASTTSNNAGGAATRGAHQLSNGLYVSGQPDRHKDKTSMMSVPQMPYTGGDVKKSGELGKMLNIPVTDTTATKRKSGTLPTPRANSGPLKATSGPLTSSGTPWIPGKSAGTISMGSATTVSGAPSSISRSGELRRATSGPLQASNSQKTSGPQPSLPTTGLITSGPITSGPLSAPRKGMSGPIGDSGRPNGASLAINCVSGAKSYSFLRNFPRMILYTLIPLFVIGFIAGAFIFAAVKNAVLLFVVAALFGSVLVVLVWNTVYGKRAVFGFMAKHPLSDLNAAKDGQLVKVTGVVTCGSVPLESSYQRVSRCVYTSTGLYEYRNYASKKARENHRRYTWGLRHRERYVVDFYISDFQTGLRALVKAGYGARVTPYVTESTIVDLIPAQKDIPTDFLRWLTERNLSADDRVMRLKEGYVKEGSTVTVMGVVQRHENILMLVPPPEPMSTGCQWARFLLPAILEGIILKSEEPSKVDGVPV